VNFRGAYLAGGGAVLMTGASILNFFSASKASFKRFISY
jgi:hypothetical protein